MPKATAVKARRVRIGFKRVKGSAVGTGVITSLSEADEDGTASVGMRLGKKSKPGSDYYPPHVHLDLPAAMVKNLSIGQEVRISVTPAEK